MRNDTTPHVEPLVLWQSACGGRDLSKRDYQHLIACTDCEALADEITDALDDIEKNADPPGTFTLTLPKVVQCDDVLARAAKIIGKLGCQNCEVSNTEQTEMSRPDSFRLSVSDDTSDTRLK